MTDINSVLNVKVIVSRCFKPGEGLEPECGPLFEAPLQAGAGQRRSAADPAAGHQVQGGRHGEHQGDAGQRRQGEARIHRREGHQQDELTHQTTHRFIDILNHYK